MKNEGMAKLVREIREFIEEKLEKGYEKFIIFPYGDVGISVKLFLNSAYGIQETYILDNHLCKYNQKIYSLADMGHIKRDEYAVLLSSINPALYKELKGNLLLYFKEEQIAELESMKKQEESAECQYHTEIGRYSYGPICREHWFIERIGSFCSFASGVEAVFNHEKRFITTHPIIYAGQTDANKKTNYREYAGEDWYMEGIKPHSDVLKFRRSKIGNDVWLGRNVLITNGADIGNGVIAGAGAVITKDVPDYAVVAGVPARIIKYRYSAEQIEQLNKIAWWDWTDDEIRDRFDDFYLPVDEFIEKYR